jgi:hypothetical protein
MIATKHLQFIALALGIWGWLAPMWGRADIALDGLPPAPSSSASTSSSSRNHETGESVSDDTTASDPSADQPPQKMVHRRHKKNAMATSPATATNSGTAVAETSGTPAAAPGAVSKTTKKKRHAKSSSSATAATSPAAGAGATATTTNTTATPAKPEPSTPTAPTPGASTAAASANPVASPQAVAKTGRHKKHGHNAGGTGQTAATKTPPTIVVTPATGPLTQQPAIHPIAPPPVTAPSTPTVSFGPTVQTGLPVARPGTGTTATLPTALAPGLNQVRAPGATTTSSYLPSTVSNFHFADEPIPPLKKATHTYPWKSHIITTVFWIGEGGSALSATTNYQSAWNMDWIHDNSGSDDQDDMSGYASSLHASTLNPFYIALPFNDLVYPDKARRWVPSYWFKPPRNGKPVSACQDRWVEIKAANGRTCFAQWEDVGPLRYDHAEYVFGNERPDTLTRAGLDVSPAVAKYLGINTHGMAITSWRFVDPDDVQPGMWLKYDEQAIIFKALKEQERRGISPIQDMEQPTPDGSAQDANQKKAGAARG